MIDFFQSSQEILCFNSTVSLEIHLIGCWSLFKFFTVFLLIFLIYPTIFHLFHTSNFFSAFPFSILHLIYWNLSLYFKVTAFKKSQLSDFILWHGTLQLPFNFIVIEHVYLENMCIEKSKTPLQKIKSPSPSLRKFPSASSATPFEFRFPSLDHKINGSALMFSPLSSLQLFLNLMKNDLFAQHLNSYELDLHLTTLKTTQTGKVDVKFIKKIHQKNEQIVLKVLMTHKFILTSFVRWKLHFNP